MLTRYCTLIQGKWQVPLPKVRTVSEAEAFRAVKSGKSKRKAWKRMVTKMCYVGDNFTRKPPKFERFIRPMALRAKRANVTHPEMKTTFCLPIIGVKKNPSSPLYTSLGVITKGTIIEASGVVLGPFHDPSSPSHSYLNSYSIGECERSWFGDSWREGGVGEVRSSDQQSGKRRLRERYSHRLS